MKYISLGDRFNSSELLVFASWFIIGRVIFSVGYLIGSSLGVPIMRAFGFSLNLMTNVLLIELAFCNQTYLTTFFFGKWSHNQINSILINLLYASIIACVFDVVYNLDILIFAVCKPQSLTSHQSRLILEGRSTKVIIIWTSHSYLTFSQQK